LRPSGRAKLILLLCATLRLHAGLPPIPSTPPPRIGGEYKSSLLYTSPEPAARGGLHLVSSLPLEAAVAIPQNNQEHVYKATLAPDGKDVSFANLPIARYDILLVTKDHFYEGISLNRDQNSLAPEDLKSIDEILSRSVPFFDIKRTEIVKGTPGDDGHAAALVQWMRVNDNGRLLNQNADQMIGHQIRSLRLAFLADVGPGWQVTATRELLRTDVFPDMPRDFLAVTHIDALNGVRVTDSAKDIGTVDLSKGTAISAPSP
jgi:hypothetical protein